MDDVIDFLMFLGGIILTAALILALAVAVVAPIDYKHCKAIGEGMGIRHEWSFWGGCLLERNGKLIPEDAWKAVELLEGK